MIVGGIDIGTTGCKLALYDDKANFIHSYYGEYKNIFHDNHHEIDFNDIKCTVFELIQQAVQAYEIAALGISSFGEAFVMLDEEDNILAPSMLYTDPRGEEECVALCSIFGSEWLSVVTGVKPNPMYSISKILWQKNNNCEIFSKCQKILLVQDFIVYTLTGNAQIDYSLAARTAAFDIDNKCWCKEIFEAFDLDEHMMSIPVPSGSVAGKISESVKKKLGITSDVTIVNGCHDQIAAMIGSGVFDASQAMDGIGTVECLAVILNKKPQNMQFYDCGYSVVPYIIGGYACYSFSFTGGAVLKWFKNVFLLDNEFEDREKINIFAELDRQIPSKPTGIFVLPHFAGAATPYMDRTSKSVFIGMSLETTKFDIYKALMEGTAYEMQANFEAMQSYVDSIKEIKVTGGGASSDVWMQIKVDISGIDITALSCREVGAAGTAALTGVTIGMFVCIQNAIDKMLHIRNVFSPQKDNREIYAKYYEKYKKIYPLVKNADLIGNM